MDELEFIKQILEAHRGKGNEISTGYIEEMLGFPRDDTHVRGRRLIKKCAEKYNIPLAGNDSGYYIMITDEELNEYKANLRSRTEKIKERERTMENNYKEWNKWSLNSTMRNFKN